MELYFMDLKEFVNHFVEMMDYEDVLHYQYVLISSTLRSNNSRENVTKMSALYPSHRLVSDWLCDHLEDDFVERYYEELSDSKVSVAVLLECVLSEEIDTVFINAPGEDKRVPYMEIFASYVQNEFGVPVYNFKRIRKGLDDFVEWDKKAALHDVKKFLNYYREEFIDMDDMSTHQRNEYIKTLRKKELRKELIKLGYPKKEVRTMSKGEVIHLIKDYYG